MAQNCCDRDRVTWPDMHSNFKMAQIFFPFVLGLFEVWTSKWPKLQDSPFDRCRKFEIVHFASKFEAIMKFGPQTLGPFWSSNLKMAQNERDKILGPFWSLNAYQVTWSYLFHSSSGPFWGISRSVEQDIGGSHQSTIQC